MENDIELLLTDEDLKYLVGYKFDESLLYDLRNVAKAQLAKAKQHYEAQITALQEIIQYLEQKRLDRPELRKRLIEWLYNELSIDTYLKDNTPKGRERWVNEEVDKLLALIPDVEGVGKLRDRLTELEKKLDDRETDLITAKREEGERMTEWLRKHCRGYHRGNNGREFGHFGIYRDEIEALKETEEG